MSTPAEARLILLSAGTAAARAASRSEAQGLIEVVDWRALATTLAARRLLPPLGERVLAIAGDRAPESFAAATRRAIDKTREQDALIELISIQLVHSLRAAGIRSLALKGPLLGKDVYGQPGRRPSRDVDLLVATEDLPGAVEVAKRLGYNSANYRPGFDRLPPLHFRLDDERHGLPPLELHWRVHWYEREFSRDLLARSIDAGQRGRRATPTDELTCSLLFYARDGFVDLRLACDLAAWWDTFGLGLQPAALEEIISRYPALERVLLAAIDVADQFVGVPSAELLSGHRRLESRVRLATRLANPDARGTRQQQVADAWLVDWLLTPPGGRRECVRRQLQAPSSMGGPRPAPGGHFAYVARGARLLRRYALSLLRLARRPPVMLEPHAAGPRSTIPRWAVGRPTG